MRWAILSSSAYHKGVNDMDYIDVRTNELHLAALQAVTERFFKEALPLLEGNGFGDVGDIATLKRENERLQEIEDVLDDNLNRAYRVVRLLHKVTDVEGWFDIDTDRYLLELEILLQHNVMGKYLTEFWEKYSKKYYFEG